MKPFITVFKDVLVCYAFFAFILWETSPGAWTYNQRAALVLTLIAVEAIRFLYLHLIAKEL